VLCVEAQNELFIEGWLQKQNVRRKLYTVHPKAYADKFRQAEPTWDTHIFPNLPFYAKF